MDHGFEANVTTHGTCRCVKCYCFSVLRPFYMRFSLKPGDLRHARYNGHFGSWDGPRSLTRHNYMSIGVFLRVFIGCITIIGDVIVRTLFPHFMSDQACTDVLPVPHAGQVESVYSGGEIHLQ